MSGDSQASFENPGGNDHVFVCMVEVPLKSRMLLFCGIKFSVRNKQSDMFLLDKRETFEGGIGSITKNQFEVIYKIASIPSAVLNSHFRFL